MTSGGTRPNAGRRKLLKDKLPPTKTRPGRKALGGIEGESQQVSARMTLADIKALEKMATSLGQTRSQCIREILKTALAKRTT